MSNCCTSNLELVAIPGPAGSPAYAVVTSAFSVPAVGSTVQVSVNQTGIFIIGQNVYAATYQSSGANFTVTSIQSATSMTLTFVGFQNDVGVGTTIGANSLIVAGTGDVILTVNTTPAQSYTTITAPFTIPSPSQNVTVSVNQIANLVSGQNVIIPGGYNFLIASVNSPVSITLTFLDFPGDSNPGLSIPAGTLIIPGNSSQNVYAGAAFVTLSNGVPTFNNGIASINNNGAAPVEITAAVTGNAFGLWTNPFPYSIEVYVDCQVIGGLVYLFKGRGGGVQFLGDQYPMFTSSYPYSSCFTFQLQPGEALRVVFGPNASQPHIYYSPL